MSFDARSLERLQALGRTLPKPLAKPEAPPPTPKASEQRHKVETETNPEALFRELMQASTDGTVPPHLLARLKELEGSRPGRRRPGAAGNPVMVNAAEAGIELGSEEPPTIPTPGQRRQRGRTTAPQRRPGQGNGDEALYTAFQQLLLEDD